MDVTDHNSDTSRQIAALRVLFAAVASAALPNTASAFTAPPSIAQCAAGTWSANGRTLCVPASLGHFVALTGATSQTPAPLGRYVDTTGATAAKLAPLGRYVDTTGASVAKLAPLGSYVDTTGASAATLAPLGRYVDTTGASVATLAPLGRYVGTTGASVATLAPLGRYVDTMGASVAKLAPLGSYVDTTGASAAKLAPLGRYVDTVGASAAKLAPAGYYVDQTGQTAALAAPAGKYAAGLGSSAAAACPSGSNSYGAGSACRILQEGFSGVAGVTPLLGSNFGTGGSHALGSLMPGDSFAFKVTNNSADLATTANLVALTLRSYTLSDPSLFDVVGFTNGVELAAGGGTAALSLQAKAGLPAGAFSFTLTLDTDQYADYQAAGKQFSYTFTGMNAAAVPEPGSIALILAGMGALALLRRRRGPPEPHA